MVSRTASGLGLGLSIARHLVELHGGMIEASSEGEGRGATFTVTFPLRETLPTAAVQNAC
jgi:signal transduction histidine kinase